jgi:hypothetical protein
MGLLPDFKPTGNLLDRYDMNKRAKPGKNPVFNFEQGEFACTPLGHIPEVQGLESLKMWAQKALLTARDRFLIYTSDYGNEAQNMIGTDFPDEIMFMELERLITETLIYDDRVDACNEFKFTREGDVVFCEFRLITALGQATTVNYQLGGERRD